MYSYSVCLFVSLWQSDHPHHAFRNGETLFIVGRGWVCGIFHTRKSLLVPVASSVSHKEPLDLKLSASIVQCRPYKDRFVTRPTMQWPVSWMGRICSYNVFRTWEMLMKSRQCGAIPKKKLFKLHAFFLPNCVSLQIAIQIKAKAV